MMTPNLCTCTWLLLPCCVLITLSTGELKPYRDEAEKIALREVAKYVEYLARQARSKQQLEESLGQSDWRKNRDLLDVLAKKEIASDLAEFHRKAKQKEWNYQRTRYNEPSDEGEYYLPLDWNSYLRLYKLNPFDSPLEYPSFKLPYPREDTGPQDEGYDYDRNVLVKQFPFEETRDLGPGTRNLDKGMKEEPTLDFHGSYASSVKEESQKQRVASPEFSFRFDGSNSEERPFAVKSNDPKYYQDTPFSFGGNEKSSFKKPHMATPEFTFRFDDSNSEEHPFAVKPNDPRYYEDAPFFLGGIEKSSFKKPEKNESKWERVNTMVEKTRMMQEDLRDIESKLLEATQAEQNPLFVPVTHDLNNDIYFIAIVAGCSAAAMFALVLITLTWCRLKRGAKAAADIEYPAYGVTGPNKEVSPSGDQRLAQSAQMYHFQHQKQQIIAMEKDPGSVSEAESEEENEEGDYTVYECPGLATTGEMEVKNPLFHDDPTPATPAQTNKEEDHI
ncbi:uncharacterized protein LOC143185177 isoform X2 [Calliopsis andreniformis]|uniref:uncharacterized protein LOC143185177 isoform X2 n=1 Tax=Calliopsis andreniformis TaxID=337506 RepID=UPI003FCDD499